MVKILREADKVEAAYRRIDLFEKRRAMMSDWASYCEQKVLTTAEMETSASKEHLPNT